MRRCRSGEDRREVIIRRQGLRFFWGHHITGEVEYGSYYQYLIQSSFSIKL